jgi:hypothetical protein
VRVEKTENDGQNEDDARNKYRKKTGLTGMLIEFARGAAANESSGKANHDHEYRREHEIADDTGDAADCGNTVANFAVCLLREEGRSRENEGQQKPARARMKHRNTSVGSSNVTEQPAEIQEACA